MRISRKLGALMLHYQVALGPQLLVIGRVQELSILAGLASRQTPVEFVRSPAVVSTGSLVALVVCRWSENYKSQDFTFYRK